VTTFLAVSAWVLVAFLLGIVPGAWFIANDQILLGLLVGVAGYGLGGGVAEIIIRITERKEKR
jgi:hypothetical protein